MEVGVMGLSIELEVLAIRTVERREDMGNTPEEERAFWLDLSRECSRIAQALQNAANEYAAMAEEASTLEGYQALRKRLESKLQSANTERTSTLEGEVESEL